MSALAASPSGFSVKRTTLRGLPSVSPGTMYPYFTLVGGFYAEEHQVGEADWTASSSPTTPS